MRDDAGARSRASLLLWSDCLGTIHACERTDLRQAFYVFSTMCGRNVPPNAHWPHHERGEISCPDCAEAALAARSRRTGYETGARSEGPAPVASTFDRLDA